LVEIEKIEVLSSDDESGESLEEDNNASEDDS
jgi:hypothetical protein